MKAKQVPELGRYLVTFLCCLFLFTSLAATKACQEDYELGTQTRVDDDDDDDDDDDTITRTPTATVTGTIDPTETPDSDDPTPTATPTVSPTVETTATSAALGRSQKEAAYALAALKDAQSLSEEAESSSETEASSAEGASPEKKTSSGTSNWLGGLYENSADIEVSVLAASTEFENASISVSRKLGLSAEAFTDSQQLRSRVRGGKAPLVLAEVAPGSGEICPTLRAIAHDSRTALGETVPNMIVIGPVERQAEVSQCTGGSLSTYMAAPVFKRTLQAALERTMQRISGQQ